MQQSTVNDQWYRIPKPFGRAACHVERFGRLMLRATSPPISALFLVHDDELDATVGRPTIIGVIGLEGAHLTKSDGVEA